MLCLPVLRFCKLPKVKARRLYANAKHAGRRGLSYNIRRGLETKLLRGWKKRMPDHSEESSSDEGNLGEYNILTPVLPPINYLASYASSMDSSEDIFGDLIGRGLDIVNALTGATVASPDVIAGSQQMLPVAPSSKRKRVRDHE
jgi:hypothetical protein